MNPQTLVELARIDHRSRVQEAERRQRRRPVPGRPRWHARGRPPSRRAVPA